MTPLPDSSADILHDHYKDTYWHIREREKQRDRLFLIVIAILGVLILQVTYTAAAAQLVSEVEILGVKARPDKLPMPAMLSTTWTFLAVILLRYCQVTTHIDKQYGYLHALEERLSKALGTDGAVARESTGYLTDKGRWFRNCVWFFYIAVFPVILLVAAGFAIVMEWCLTGIPVPHRCYDTALAAGVAGSVALYVAGVSFGR